MRIKNIRSAANQSKTENSFKLGHYQFEDFEMGDSIYYIVYCVLLTDPDGKQHLGSSLESRLEAVSNAAHQVLTASDYAVDWFALEMLASGHSEADHISFQTRQDFCEHK